MSRFFNSRYQNLCAYTPGEQPTDMQYIKLNTNESPYPPSPEVQAAVNFAEVARLNLYPDPTLGALRERIGQHFGVKKENIFASNGSDDILNFAFMAFCGEKRQAYFADITYGFYRVFCDLHGISYTLIPLKDDFSIDPSDYMDRDGIIVIANPNAPTGKVLACDAIERIVQGNPNTVVLVDEAYVDFGAQSCAALTAKYNNLLVVQTFSKSRSLAGARLGFAVADSGLIDDLERIRYSTNPYNINRLTMAAGIAAIDSEYYYRGMCEKIIQTREYSMKKLCDMGFYVIPSQTNFIFARHSNLSGQALYEKLRARGILIRHFSGNRIADYNRITVGTREQMNRLLDAIGQILSEDKNQ